MAELCDICVKTFNCQWKELQDFLRPCTPQGLKEEPLTVFEEAEVHHGCSPSSKHSPDYTEVARVICEKGSNVKDNDEEDRDSSSTGPDFNCKRPKLSPSLSTSSPTPIESHDQQEKKRKVCCPAVQCVACLGLLEEDYIHHLAHIITEHVTQVCPLGMETFSLSIHIPLSIAARGMGMEMLSKTIRSDLDDNSELTPSESNYVKEELRLKLKKELEASLSPLIYFWDSPLTIALNLEHSTCLRTCIGVKKLRPRFFPRPKKKRNFKKSIPTPITGLPLQKALNDLSDDDFVKENFFLSHISSPCSHQVELTHKSCFIAGRYNKYSRELPQTPWVVDGIKKAETSVQELICPKVLHAFRASDVRFSSSGREDVDVFMLGQGRPFLLELINPMNISVSEHELEELEKEINVGTELVAVNKLKRVSKESSTLLKQGEEEKRKIYSALVWTKEEVSRDLLRLLDDSKDLMIQQRTPMRVLHRRTLAVREKKIYFMETEQIDGHHFFLRLGTQAGTYIKEFVHGDFGRTQPNVGTLLGCDADILSLDVLDVQLQWPP